MQTTYGERLAIAREQAGLSQAELARRIGLKPQAVQYLEQQKNAARGSRHTPRFAQACGVNAIWLESGEGSMHTGAAAREPSATYELERPAALASAIRELRPELRRAVAQIVQSLRKDGPRQYILTASERREQSERPPARRRRAA